MTDEIIAKLEALIAEAIIEQTDIDYYVGGTPINYSQRQLGAFMMKNGATLIASLKARSQDNDG